MRPRAECTISSPAPGSDGCPRSTERTHAWRGNPTDNFVAGKLHPWLVGAGGLILALVFAGLKVPQPGFQVGPPSIIRRFGSTLAGLESVQPFLQLMRINAPRRLCFVRRRRLALP